MRFFRRLLPAALAILSFVLPGSALGQAPLSLDKAFAGVRDGLSTVEAQVHADLERPVDITPEPSPDTPVSEVA